MALNNQKGNMYGFVTHTWNTIKGKCQHDCSYCYMKRWGNLKNIRFDEKELKTDLGKNNFIFIGSSCDMFAENIPEKWITDTIEYIEKYDNMYLFQSKNAVRMTSFVFPLRKTILCTTIESDNNELLDKITKAPDVIKNRFNAFKNLSMYNKMVTIEPIIDFNLKNFLSILQIINPVQINIGADSKNSGLPEPSKEKTIELIRELEKTNIKLFLKDNLKRIIG